MTSNPLENLAGTGQLKPEPPAKAELNGLFLSGQRRLVDAGQESLSLESRFDLAYSAAHALALTALRLRCLLGGSVVCPMRLRLMRGAQHAMIIL